MFDLLRVFVSYVMVFFRVISLLMWELSFSFDVRLCVCLFCVCNCVFV